MDNMLRAKVNILGVGISAINMVQAIETIDGWIRRREPHYVTVTPVHSLMDCCRDPETRRIFNASGLTTPDGMPLVWLLRLKGHRHVGRVYGPDLMLAVCRRSLDRGYRHFFYGGAPGVPEHLAAGLQHRFPGLLIAGTHSPPFKSLTYEEDARIINQINDADPDVLWVGISSPKQERWMAAHQGKVKAPVMIGVGAAFDFLSGRKRQAPKWMRRSGLEWLFRLLNEPRRLWKRYLINNPWFVFLVILQLSGLRKYEIEN